jgi:hypothetical protein
MKTIVGTFLAALLLTSSAHASPVVLHIQGTASGGQLARGTEVTPIAGIPFDLRIFGDDTVPAVPLNDFFFLPAEIEFFGTDSHGVGLGGLKVPLVLLEQISGFVLSGFSGGVDALKLRLGTDGLDSFVFLPLHTLPDPGFIKPFGSSAHSVETVGPSSIAFFVAPGGIGQPHELDFSAANTLGSRITVFATTEVPEPGSLGLIAISCAVVEVFRRRMRSRS